MNWARACEVPAEFERGVKILLVHLHPEAEPIDGAGGDGGRDVIVRTSDRLVIYEVKAFADRLTSSRKRQVKRSLARAAENKPDEWHLVLAHDLNSAAMQWFDSLREEYEFPLHWHGYSWLEAQLIAAPRMRRAFTSTAIELLEMASELELERAAVRDLDDLRARFENLYNIADNFSPTHRVTYTPGAEGMGRGELQLIRRDGTPEPDELSVSFNVTVPAGDEHNPVREALTRLRAFGDPMVVTKPYLTDLRLDGPGRSGSDSRDPAVTEIELSGVEDHDDVPTTTITVSAPSGVRLASVPFIGQFRRRGEEGVRVIAHDLNHVVELMVTISGPAGEPTLSLRPLNNADKFPHQLVPTINLLNALREPNTAVATVSVPPGAPQNFGQLSLTDLPELDGETSRANDFVLGLAALQEAAGDYFLLPERFSPSQAAVVSRIRSLLNGETVRWARDPRALWVHRDGAESVARAKAEGNAPEHLEIVHADPVVRVFDRDLHIGPIVISGDVTVVDDQYLHGFADDAEYLPVLVDPGEAGFLARRPTAEELEPSR